MTSATKSWQDATQMFDLSDRVAIVTGAGTGIGAACARMLAVHGASVVLASRNLGRLEVVASEISAVTGRVCVPHATNVKDEGDCVALVASTIERFGRIDVLVNNAGGVRFGSLLELPAKAWDSVHELNVRGPFMLTREVGRHMVANRAGSIVNIGSSAGAHGTIGGAHYSSAKAGLHVLTRVVAAELGPYGVRCNCVSPSAPIISENVAEAMENGNMDGDKIAKDIPLRRLGVPDEIAWPVLFFASDASSYVNGQTLEVDGGPSRLYGSIEPAENG